MCVCMFYLLLLMIDVSLVNFHLRVFISTELKIFSCWVFTRIVNL